MAKLIVEVRSSSAPEAVFEALVDWQGQANWIPATTVDVLAGSGREVGSVIGAFTGYGKAGFMDTMTITRWQPPRALDVLHTGRVVRGPALMRVVPTEDGGCRVIMGEDIEAPLGRLGELGWHVVKPFLRPVFRRSLQRLTRSVEGQPPMR